MKLKGNLKINFGRTTIEVPYNGKIIKFFYPQFEQLSFYKAVKRLKQENLLFPTSSQMISLLDILLQNEKEPICKKILRYFNEEFNAFWTSTETIYEGNNVFIYDNPEGKTITRNSLKKILEKEDNLVRRVKAYTPDNYRQGNTAIQKALTYPYLAAHIGKEMLPIFEKVANKIANKSEKKEDKRTVCIDGTYDSSISQHDEGRNFAIIGIENGFFSEGKTYRYSHLFLKGNRSNDLEESAIGTLKYSVIGLIKK